MKIRKAQLSDISSITAIYNEAVLNTTATFDTELRSEDDRRHWFTNRDHNFPVLVAEQNGEVIGYASLSRWSDKKAYDITAELSLYIHAEHRNKGVGKILFKALLEASHHTALHSIIARITEGNEHSIHLHKQGGFETVGVLKQCGRKFGKLLDVTVMQKMVR
jgi:L-amino acid N-acyltransferase